VPRSSFRPASTKNENLDQTLTGMVSTFPIFPFYQKVATYAVRP
jgi:hypothetical protein